MKYTASAQKTARTTAESAIPNASAGPNGIALSPPAYGMEVVDHQPIQAAPEQGQTPLSLASATWPAGEGLISPGFVIQPKLTIGPVGDRYEQEADRMAQQVVRQINLDHIPRVLAALAGQKATG